MDDVSKKTLGSLDQGERRVILSVSLRNISPYVLKQLKTLSVQASKQSVFDVLGKTLLSKNNLIMTLPGLKKGDWVRISPSEKKSKTGLLFVSFGDAGDFSKIQRHKTFGQWTVDQWSKSEEKKRVDQYYRDKQRRVLYRILYALGLELGLGSSSLSEHDSRAFGVEGCAADQMLRERSIQSTQQTFGLHCGVKNIFLKNYTRGPFTMLHRGEKKRKRLLQYVVQPGVFYPAEVSMPFKTSNAKYLNTHCKTCDGFRLSPLQRVASFLSKAAWTQNREDLNAEDRPVLSGKAKLKKKVKFKKKKHKSDAMFLPAESFEGEIILMREGTKRRKGQKGRQVFIQPKWRKRFQDATLEPQPGQMNQTSRVYRLRDRKYLTIRDAFGRASFVREKNPPGGWENKPLEPPEGFSREDGLWLNEFFSYTSGFLPTPLDNTNRIWSVGKNFFWLSHEEKELVLDWSWRKYVKMSYGKGGWGFSGKKVFVDLTADLPREF